MSDRMGSSKIVVRRLKEKCKDAARMRREKERSEFVELSKLLPLPSSTTSQLDRASIIRLTSSYLRMRAAFPEGLGENWGTQRPASLSLSSSPNCNSHVASRLSPSASYTLPTNDAAAAAAGVHQQHIDPIDGPSEQQTIPKRQNLRNSINQAYEQQNHYQQLHQAQVKELGSLILQTLDGFVFALHSDGKIMYISETASVLLGLPQIDLTGSSIFDYIESSDHNDLVEVLSLNDTDRCNLRSQEGMHLTNSADPVDYSELSRSFSMRMKCILPRRNAGLIHNGFKSIHCTGYLKVKRRRPEQPLPMPNSSSKLLDKNQHNTISRAYNTRPLSHLQPSKSRGLADDQDWASYALVAVGHSLLPSASTEIKLNRNSFMFRANLDMKIFFIESSALSLLGHDQSSVVGQSLYQMVHLADLKHLEDAHRTLLNKGEIVSKYIRLMRQDCGPLWIQMQASLINNPRSMPSRLHIVGICLIIGENRFDESQMMLDKLSNDNRSESCIRMSASFNLLANPIGQACRRRQITKINSSATDSRAIKDDAPKSISSHNKRAISKRREKSESPNKRVRYDVNDDQDTKSTDIEEAKLEIPGRVDIDSDKKVVNEGNLTINQPIGQLRRFSDDTCSVASSTTSASTTTASSTSHIGQFIVSCPPSSRASGCSFSSVSPRSLPTIVAPSASQYLPIQRTSPIIAEAKEFTPIESDVRPTGRHVQLHEQQHFCTQATTSGNTEIDQITHMDPNRYPSNNYWPIESDEQSSLEQGRFCTENIQNQFNQALPGPNYYNFNEQRTDLDDHSRNYCYYSDNEVTFYNGSHNANLHTCETRCYSENFVVDQFTPHQYSYLADDKSARESMNKNTMTPVARPCFVANQYF